MINDKQKSKIKYGNGWIDTPSLPQQMADAELHAWAPVESKSVELFTLTHSVMVWTHKQRVRWPGRQ